MYACVSDELADAQTTIAVLQGQVYVCERD